MKSVAVPSAIAAMCLAGCGRPANGGLTVAPHGRYAGVGVYPAGRMWSQQAVGDPSRDLASAKLRDDEQVIVVVDSNTGELRQCGNLSGYCVGLAPWAKPLAAGQVGPTPLLKHADQLQAEAEARAKSGPNPEP